VVGAEALAGVRFAAPGEEDAVLLTASRRGVPEGGFVAAAVDILCCAYLLLVCFVGQFR
jgi:hypothetical protein